MTRAPIIPPIKDPMHAALVAATAAPINSPYLAAAMQSLSDAVRIAGEREMARVSATLAKAYEGTARAAVAQLDIASRDAAARIAAVALTRPAVIGWPASQAQRDRVCRMITSAANRGITARRGITSRATRTRGKQT